MPAARVISNDMDKAAEEGKAKGTATLLCQKPSLPPSTFFFTAFFLLLPTQRAIAPGV